MEREFAKAHLRLKIDTDLIDVAQEMGYSELDKLLAAVGSGVLNHAKVVGRVTPRKESATIELLLRMS